MNNTKTRMILRIMVDIFIDDFFNKNNILKYYTLLIFFIS